MTIRLLAVVLLAGACSSPKSEADLAPEYRQLMITSVRNPYALLPAAGKFSWLQSRVSTGNDLIPESVVETTIREKLQQEMGGKGFALAAATTADVLVGYMATREDEMDDSTIDKYYGHGPGWRPGGANPQRYEKGTLVVDVVMAGSRRPVWRGSVSALIAPDLPEAARRARIERAITTLMARFPN